MEGDYITIILKRKDGETIKNPLTGIRVFDKLFDVQNKNRLFKQYYLNEKGYIKCPIKVLNKIKNSTEGIFITLSYLGLRDEQIRDIKQIQSYLANRFKTMNITIIIGTIYSPK